MSFDLADYVDVAERVRLFKEQHPDGSLQSEAVFTNDGWMCVAQAYRTPDDPRPGIGHAFVQVPGRTPYTKDSELENAETSAWGRAIAALGFATKKIASADEIRMRQPSGEPTRVTADRDPGPSVKVNPSAEASPENPAAKAQAAAEAAKAARTPQDDGIPENVILTFGKHKGTNLGAVPRAYLEWLTANFEAKNAEQRRVLTAAQLIINGPALSGADDDIPF